MPISFNNTGAALISEVEHAWEEPQDWTINNFNALKLFTHGASFSTAGELYLIIGDNGIGISEELDFKKSETLGFQLVTNLVEHQLAGQIEVRRNGGTEFRIRFKHLTGKERI